MERYDRPEHIKIGTRGSLLAQVQTDLFIARMRECYPGLSCEKVIIRTQGDRILDKPLQEFGGKAVFVNEFEDAILEGKIDCAVHSAKDMPMELAKGLSIVCALPREDARDVLITLAKAETYHLSEMLIGTGSLRRAAQLEMICPGVRCASVRGNVPTRLEKLKHGEYEGLVLAAAGIKRLGIAEDAAYNYRYFSPEEMVPAGGQGIIAIEGREHESGFYEPAADACAMAELMTERYVLALLGAGCHEAVGVHAQCMGSPGWDGMRLNLMKGQSGNVYRKMGMLPPADWKPSAETLVQELLEEPGAQTLQNGE